MDTNEKGISLLSQIEGQDVLGASEGLAPMGENQTSKFQEVSEDKVELLEEQQVPYVLEVVEDSSKPPEIAFAEQMERELVATNYPLEKNEIQIQQKENAVNKEAEAPISDVAEEPNKKLNWEYFQKKADLEWENPMGIDANFKPKINHNMQMLLTTDGKNAQKIVKANLTSINPAGYRNVEMPEVFKNILVNSMVDIGQIALVGLVKSKNPKYYYDVLYGRKRIKALSIKGEDYICGVLYDSDDKDILKTIEIDEQLLKSDLTHAQKCRMIAEKQKIHERRFPSSTAAEQRKKGLKNTSDEIISLLQEYRTFTEEAAELMKVNKRTVQLDSQIAREITESNWELIMGSILENRKLELIELAKMKDKEIQTIAIKAVLSGQVKKVKDAMGLHPEKTFLAPITSPKSEDPKQLTFDLKIAVDKIKELEKRNSKLENKVKELEAELKRVKKFKKPAIPELDLYPYTDTNKDSIQEEEIEGGNNE